MSLRMAAWTHGTFILYSLAGPLVRSKPFVSPLSGYSARQKQTIGLAPSNLRPRGIDIHSFIQDTPRLRRHAFLQVVEGSACRAAVVVIDFIR